MMNRSYPRMFPLFVLVGSLLSLSACRVEPEATSEGLGPWPQGPRVLRMTNRPKARPPISPNYVKWLSLFPPSSREQEDPRIEAATTRMDNASNDSKEPPKAVPTRHQMGYSVSRTSVSVSSQYLNIYIPGDDMAVQIIGKMPANYVSGPLQYTVGESGVTVTLIRGFDYETAVAGEITIANAQMAIRSGGAILKLMTTKPLEFPSGIIVPIDEEPKNASN